MTADFHINFLNALLKAKRFLTLRESLVLIWLYRFGGPIDMGDLRRDLLCSNSALCRIIDQLSICGYVSRLGNDRDRRKRDIKLTAEGERFVEKVLKG